jgi:nitronate monooxygenase
MTSELQELLSLDHPIVQGPFGGGMSSVALAAAVAEAGGLGSYGANVLTPDGITDVVGQIRSRTDRSFAINLWVPQPGEQDPADEAVLAAHAARMQPFLDRHGLPPLHAAYPYLPDFAAQAEALLAAAPPAMSFVMGIPPRWVLDEARRRGIVTIGTATTVDEAVAIADAGLDAVVASGAEAGGHRGAFLAPVRESLVGTFALVPQVADAVSIPVVAAGGIADRRGVAAALALGADGVQIGTGFLVTAESGASEVHKQALLSPRARTTVLTRLFSGRTARGIANDLVRELAELEETVPPYPVQNALMKPIREAAARAGDDRFVNLWSGQAAGLVKARGAADYLRSLVE